MRRCVVAATIAALIAVVAGGVGAAPQNLVKNGGFEEVGADGNPTAWSGWNDVWSGDTTAHGGARSARFKNADAGRYVLLTQTIPARPGYRYRVSCWIRPEGVSEADGGATACLEWSDRAGTYLGGFYPRGFHGTADWQQLDALSSRIPANAGRVTVTVYVRRTGTGTAWFDDVSVTEEPDAPFEGAIRLPGYRGQVTADARERPLAVRGRLGEDDAHPLSTRRLRVEIRRAGSAKVVSSREVAAPATPEVDLEIPVRTLPVGHYDVRLTVTAAGAAAPLAVENASFTRVAGLPTTGVVLRPDGATLVAGKPFFPLGVYEGAAPGEAASLARLDEIARGGFNCVLNYSLCGASPESARVYLDHAQKLGLKVIYSVKDIYFGTTWDVKKVGEWEGDEAIFKGVVRTFRDHPAVLAWYLNDELPLTEHARLRRNYEWLTQTDPHHPGYVVLYQAGELDGYVDTTDVMGVDPYPIPDNPVTMAADWTDAAVASGRPAWVVPQIFDWSVYNKERKPSPPTYEQMRCMIYLALIHGATGLVPYSYFDLKRSPEFDRRWGEVTRIAAEVNQLAPTLTAGGAGPLVRHGGLHLRTWRDGADTLMLVANGQNEAAQQLLPLPPGITHAEPLFGTPLPTLLGGTLSAQFAPLAVHVYRLRP